MKWSILICTLEKRREQFERLHQKLQRQIKRERLTGQVEVCFHRDQGELSVGAKRNHLLRNCQGEYSCFIDDDDDISHLYVRSIFRALQHNPDCVSLTGIITWNGERPRTFIHSLRYQEFFEKNEVYYRPPNHLNPIKRALILPFRFPNVRHGEDTKWALRVASAGVLKTEQTVIKPLYFYLFVPRNSATYRHRKTHTG